MIMSPLQTLIDALLDGARARNARNVHIDIEDALYEEDADERSLTIADDGAGIESPETLLRGTPAEDLTRAQVHAAIALRALSGSTVALGADTLAEQRTLLVQSYRRVPVGERCVGWYAEIEPGYSGPVPAIETLLGPTESEGTMMTLTLRADETGCLHKIIRDAVRRIPVTVVLCDGTDGDDGRIIEERIEPETAPAAS